MKSPAWSIARRIGRASLLFAAYAMVLQTGCSHRSSTKDLRKLDIEGQKRVTVKIRTNDRMLYVASRFEVTDSTVVINELVRDPKLYERKAKLYDTSPALKVPPADLALPFTIPLRDVTYMQTVADPPVGSSAVVGGVLLGLIGALVLLAIAVSGISLGT